MHFLNFSRSLFVEVSPSLVGCEGVGYLYQPPCDEDDQDDILDVWPAAAAESDEDAESDAETDSDQISPSSSPPPEDDKCTNLKYFNLLN